MKGMHGYLRNVLKNINKVKKTLRTKKYCFDECNDEKNQKNISISFKSRSFSAIQIARFLDRSWTSDGRNG